jgi:hypothetical protein
MSKITIEECEVPGVPTGIPRTALMRFNVAVTSSGEPLTDFDCKTLARVVVEDGERTQATSIKQSIGQ